MLVALDWDRDDVAAIAAMETFPPRYGKEGRGASPRSIVSKAADPTARLFKISGAVAVQVLSDGTQTVLPPSSASRHQAPIYLGRQVYPVRRPVPTDLPETPRWTILRRIEAILRPLGYELEPEEPKSNGHDHEAGDNPFGELNKLALRNLVAWVPDAGPLQVQAQAWAPSRLL